MFSKPLGSAIISPVLRPQKGVETLRRNPPFAANLHRRELPGLNHLADLLAGGLEQDSRLLHRQYPAHSQGPFLTLLL